MARRGRGQPPVKVEVVCALPETAVVATVEVEPGTTLREAVERSGILRRCPGVDLGRNPVGVFGRLRDPGEAVRAGDRIEIYRSLPVDPKEMRRRRARAPTWGR